MTIEPPDATNVSIAGVLLTLGAWVWRRLVGELDGKADKDDLLKLIEQIKEQNRDAAASRLRVYNKLEELRRETNACAVSIARLQGNNDQAP